MARWIEWTVAQSWDGVALSPEQHVHLALADDGDALLLRVRAPFRHDPPPEAPPGPTDRLWEHEVVEWFVAGPGERYLEVELGPHGHHLVLKLDGVRRVVEAGLPLAYTARIEGEHWEGVARIPRSWLPEGPHRGNAYAIHGTGPARRHLAMAPVPGQAPDFHRLEHFLEVELP